MDGCCSYQGRRTHVQYASLGWASYPAAVCLLVTRGYHQLSPRTIFHRARDMLRSWSFYYHVNYCHAAKIIIFHHAWGQRNKSTKHRHQVISGRRNDTQHFLQYNRRFPVPTLQRRCSPTTAASVVSMKKNRDL